MSNEFHPFWEGVFAEFKKEAVDPASVAQAAAQNPEAAAGVGAAGLLAGLGAVALKRKLFKGKAPKSAPAPEAPPPPQGWSGRAVLGATAAGAAGGYYLGRKQSE